MCTLTMHRNEFEGVESAAFSPDGKRIVIGSNGGDSFLQIWDTATGAEVSRFVGVR